MTFVAWDEKPVENIEGKGVNAGNLYNFVFPQCFLPYEI